MEKFDLRCWKNFASAGGDITHPAWVDQISIDSRSIYTQNSLFVALKGERQDGHHFVNDAKKNGAKFALVSVDFPAMKDSELILLRVLEPLIAFQEIALAYRKQLPTKFIGIIGSFGKTMVKDLLLKFLSTQYHCAASPESFNSQIGVPLSLLTIERHHEFAIIEAAFSKQNEIRKLADLICPDYTLLTPIGKKHLATLNSCQTISDEIIKFLQVTSPQGWVLVPSSFDHNFENDILFATHVWDTSNKSLPYAISLATKGHPCPPYQINFPDGKKFVGTSSTGHNYFLNLINMAVKAAWLLDINYENICKVLQDFIPEPTHSEIWKSPRGAIFVNEPYCSDPQSLDKALSHFNYATSKQRKIFVFGGIRMDPEYAAPAYRLIGQSIARAAIDEVILFGPHNYQEMIHEIRNLSKNTSISHVTDQTEAFNFLSDRLEPNDYVVIKGDKKIPLEKLTEIFHESLSNNQCFINLAAIQNNIHMIRQSLAPQTRLMIMVKAFAYGTDDERLAKYLSYLGIDILGVSYVDEAITLKRQGITQSIFTVNAANYEISKVIKWQLEVGVSNKEFASALAEAASLQNQTVKVHLHVDTGMGRFGCRPEEALEIAQFIAASPQLVLEGLMTHLTCADNPQEDAFTHKQIETFDHIIALLKAHDIYPKWIHAANSSATLRFKLPQYNMVRVGLATFGLHLSKSAKEALDLRLALTLTSRIVGINVCKKGETVSYGKSYHIEEEEQKIAVLPIGYFDGLHRKYSGKSHVIIRGQPAPMVGNICMDYMMVNITHIPDATIGDKALIFGQDEYGHYLSPEELAIKGDSIIHELITCLGPRIQRIFVDEESLQVH